MVVLLRATVSKVLYEQMTYRGTRPYPDKRHFILLDMGGNLIRHGALGSPYREKGAKEMQDATGKICPECETFVVGTMTGQCPDCGYRWPEPEGRKVHHEMQADTKSKTVYQGAIETYRVNGVRYAEHKSRKTGNVSLRVDYLCDTKYGKISEWLSPHHEKEFVRGKAYEFFKERGWEAYGGIEKYNMEALLYHANNLKVPMEIVVDHGGEFPRIKRHVFAERPREAISVADVLGDDRIEF